MRRYDFRDTAVVFLSIVCALVFLLLENQTLNITFPSPPVFIKNFSVPLKDQNVNNHTMEATEDSWCSDLFPKMASRIQCRGIAIIHKDQTS